ncbi:MAG: DUF86 domain-containing protein [Clostridia bacterium]|nr:DUF86 domain-containing protein [Clostridia bacterium]
MTDKDRVILHKIIRYATEAMDYISGFGFEDFLSDNKTVSACAFIVGQIGELSSHISEGARAAHANIPWRSIRGMRNKLVHDYDNVDMAVLWGTISKSMPELINQLEALTAPPSY